MRALLLRGCQDGGLWEFGTGCDGLSGALGHGERELFQREWGVAGFGAAVYGVGFGE
ncbi:MAG: hypothetical protein K6U12_07305 [Armatimonadetes bacterium]|nr:hypothetical protein [Armatimonadota bacterium]